MRCIVYIASNIRAENDGACYTIFHSHRVGTKVQAKDVHVHTWSSGPLLSYPNGSSFPYLWVWSVSGGPEV